MTRFPARLPLNVLVLLALGVPGMACSDLHRGQRYDVPLDVGLDHGGGSDPRRDVAARPDGSGDPGEDGEAFDASPSGDADPGGPTANEFGAPCSSNVDCVSGFCVSAGAGTVCSKNCVEDCPDGWTCRIIMMGSDPVGLCMPLGSSLCRPCVGDAGCDNGVCITLDEGRYCSRGCDTEACPTGFGCADTPSAEGGKTTRQCRPLNGTCTCQATMEGLERQCSMGNEFGTCLGIERCDPAQGWVGCTAQPATVEVCNGIDDDCDGLADEGSTICDDHDPCTQDTCGGYNGCQYEKISGC